MAAIPLPLDKMFFKEIEVLFRNFIWNNKTPRVSVKNMYVDRELGGLDIPNVYKYYIAFNARYPLKWGYRVDLRDTSWESIQQEALDMHKGKLSLQGMWCAPTCKKLKDL